MTKISQLSSIGDSLAVDDQFLIRDVSDGSTPNKSVTVSGITRALDLGTAAAPAIAFATDKNTGIYSPGADQVAVATNGTARLYIASDGKVGVGTASPGSLLHAAGKIRFGNNATYYGEIDHDASSTGANIYDHSDSGGHIFRKNGTEQLRIDSSGRLLVGTSSALTALSFSSIAPQIQLAGSTTSAASILAHKFGDDADPCKLILLKNRGIDAISNAGLSVNDPLGVISFEAIDGYGGSTLIGAEIGAYAESGHGSANDDGPARLVFSTTADGASSPTERMRITNAGYLWINRTTAPATTNTVLAVAGGSANLCAIFDRTVNDDIIRFTRSEALVGSISVTTTATAYNTSSDHRLKENVTAVTDGITRLQQLKPSRFNFIADPDRTVDGFIAHEAQEVVPECVTGTKDAVDDKGNPVYQGIDQSKLVPLLTAALQEAIDRIEQLEAAVATLQGS